MMNIGAPGTTVAQGTAAQHHSQELGHTAHADARPLHEASRCCSASSGTVGAMVIVQRLAESLASGTLDATALRAAVALTRCQSCDSLCTRQAQDELGHLGLIEALAAAAVLARVAPSPNTLPSHDNTWVACDALHTLRNLCCGNATNSWRLGAAGGWATVKAVLLPHHGPSLSEVQLHCHQLLVDLACADGSELGQVLEVMAMTCNVLQQQRLQHPPQPQTQSALKGRGASVSAAWCLSRLAAEALLSPRRLASQQWVALGWQHLWPLVGGQVMSLVLEELRGCPVQERALLQHLMAFTTTVAQATQHWGMGAAPQQQLQQQQRAVLSQLLSTAGTMVLSWCGVVSEPLLLAGSLRCLHALAACPLEVQLQVQPGAITDITLGAMAAARAAAAAASTVPEAGPGKALAAGGTAANIALMVQVYGLGFMGQAVKRGWVVGSPPSPALMPAVHAAMGMAAAMLEQHSPSAHQDLAISACPEGSLPAGASACRQAHACWGAHWRMGVADLTAAAGAAATLLLWCGGPTGVNSVDSSGSGMLHRLSAAGCGQVLVSYMAAAGQHLDLRLRDANGAEPATVARACNQPALAELLELALANDARTTTAHPFAPLPPASPPPQSPGGGFGSGDGQQPGAAPTQWGGPGLAAGPHMGQGQGLFQQSSQPLPLGQMPSPGSMQGSPLSQSQGSPGSLRGTPMAHIPGAGSERTNSHSWGQTTEPAKGGSIWSTGPLVLSPTSLSSSPGSLAALNQAGAAGAAVEGWLGSADTSVSPAVKSAPAQGADGACAGDNKGEGGDVKDDGAQVVEAAASDECAAGMQAVVSGLEGLVLDGSVQQTSDRQAVGRAGTKEHAGDDQGASDATDDTGSGADSPDDKDDATGDGALDTASNAGATKGTPFQRRSTRRGDRPLSGVGSSDSGERFRSTLCNPNSSSNGSSTSLAAESGAEGEERSREGNDSPACALHGSEEGLTAAGGVDRSDAGSAGAPSGTESDEAGSEEDGEGKPSRHLWLGNIPLRPNKAAMELLFSNFGPLESVRVFPGKTFAFVNFMEAQDAIAAKSALDGQAAPAVTGAKPLAIRFQKDTSSVPSSAGATGDGSVRRIPSAHGGLSHSNSAANLSLSGLGGLHSPLGMTPLGRLLDDDLGGAPEPAVNLSNRLNPNNVHFDKELAFRYKRMSKAEKEALWAQDRVLQQLASNSSAAAALMGSVGATDPAAAATAAAVAAAAQLFPGAGMGGLAAGAMGLQQQQQQQAAAAMAALTQPALANVASMGGVNALHRALSSSALDAYLHTRPSAAGVHGAGTLGRMGPGGGMGLGGAHPMTSAQHMAAATAAAKAMAAQQLLQQQVTGLLGQPQLAGAAAAAAAAAAGSGLGAAGARAPSVELLQQALLQQQLAIGAAGVGAAGWGGMGAGLMASQTAQQQQQQARLLQQQLLQQQQQQQQLLAVQRLGAASAAAAAASLQQQQQLLLQVQPQASLFGPNPAAYGASANAGVTHQRQPGGMSLGAGGSSQGLGGQGALGPLGLSGGMAGQGLSGLGGLGGQGGMGGLGLGGAHGGLGGMGGLTHAASTPNLYQMASGSGAQMLSSLAQLPSLDLASASDPLHTQPSARSSLAPVGTRTHSAFEAQGPPGSALQPSDGTMGAMSGGALSQGDMHGPPGSRAPASAAGPGGLPASFLCPLSGVVMTDPVVASDGVTYERAAISEWMQQREVSPITGAPLANRLLAPNYQLQSAVLQEFARGV